MGLPSSHRVSTGTDMVFLVVPALVLVLALFCIRILIRIRILTFFHGQVHRIIERLLSILCPDTTGGAYMLWLIGHPYLIGGFNRLLLPTVGTYVRTYLLWLIVRLIARQTLRLLLAARNVLLVDLAGKRRSRLDSKAPPLLRFGERRELGEGRT